ncbi:D-hexose-6-phosphate mutarotase [Thiohalophilus sp.]|uniref:D-hexose-6-phosphate mutarotase n=1 Tax=Thiohalophilus sp. TaxID=3028392 RepID=UPI002ACD45B5|nr:D-hexose-6-phosphate mutarotase [Thiohalophilus sp.]MDZ7663365.1 D-hexose-6-phosphate mutarotase [Thiohalophilus sp.]
MLEELNQRFAHPDVRFSQKDQLIMIELNNRHGSATLTTHGGTLLSYQPAGGEEVIWLSETAIYDGSKPVRGGVPICWPWFGPYDPDTLGADPTDAAKKGHGVARYELWEVAGVRSVDNEATELVLQLEPNDSIRQAWPLPFMLKLIVTLGEKLTLELVGENRSERDWVVSEAFHTYFNVARADGLTIEGLDNTAYIDKGRDGQRFTQEGPLPLTLPMECIFVDHNNDVVIDDEGHGRRIVMEKINSASTVVWNPGPEGAKGFADMPDDQYDHMVCVEAANALDNAYTLKAGESHSMKMTIAVN